MNPNSEGEAYIDDFEASKQTFPLGESALTWRQASPPADFWKTTRSWDSLLTHPPAWQSYWFNPVDNHTQYRVERNSIWLPDPDERVTSSQERFARVLRFHTTPAPSGALGGQYVNPWAGIMTFVPASFKNREKDKYFEFVAKNIGGGRLYIDMGVISEDIAIGGAPPDNQTNTEDSTYIYDYRRELDLGLDKLPDASESYRVPDLAAGRFVDLDTSLYPYSQTDPNHLLDRGDPGRDNWREYTTQKLDNFRFVNGLQGDQRLTSEDINLDNSNVNIYMERFFRFVIDFDSLRIIGYDPAGRQHTWFLDTSANLSDTGGFHRFRIPLQSGARVDTVKSGAINPSWRDIQAIRLWWSDFDPADRSREKQLLLSQIQFVANQWLEIPRAGADSTQPAQVKIEASVINTEEDRNYLGMFDSRSAYYQPTPFRRPVDSKGDPKREQSLRLNFRNLGENDEALVERLFTFQPMNLSNYKTLSIYVRADKDYEPYKTSFVYRFGTDSTTYYEYRTGYLTPGWATDNHVAIDLEELSMLKLAWQDNHGDNDSAIDTVSADGRYRIRARGGKTPPFSDIRWMALGVARDAGAAGDYRFALVNSGDGPLSVASLLAYVD